jgi:hypothetical protein
MSPGSTESRQLSVWTLDQIEIRAAGLKDARLTVVRGGMYGGRVDPAPLIAASRRLHSASPVQAASDALIAPGVLQRQ